MNWRRTPVRAGLLVLALPWAVALAGGCEAPGEGESGPYVEAVPGSDLDLGRVPHGDTAEALVEFRNVGPFRWRLELSSDLNHVEIACVDADPCDEADPGESLTWRVTATSDGPDGEKVSQARVTVLDLDDAEGGAAPELDEFTLVVRWITCGGDTSCDDPA
ncbi:hypothetical protein L6R50_14300 [Myxococcota bacterium]|nr:hypothetical protein [Myxococcota bacterium]